MNQVINLQPIPTNGKDGLILISKNNIGVWTDFDMTDTLSYGVEWKPNVADPVLTRIGNKELHRTLPIQSGMKGCVYNPKEKRVVYWLDESNWTYKKGGNPNKGEPEQLSRLDGYDGEVMVYVPEFYIKSWDEADNRAVRISTVKIDDTWQHQPATFIAAYHDAILREVPTDMGYLSTLPVNSLVSIANSNAYCRGGNNNSSWDTDADIFRRNLGKPATNINRINGRTYARNANKELLSYRLYKNILYWLWIIEYATFNSQAGYNSALTSEGYHQGGMGNSVTNVSNWSAFNDYNPITPNGYTNDIGNGTGIKLITPNGPAPVGGVYANRWRGIENNFGDIWSNLDGILINSSSLTINGNKISEVYSTDNPSLYSDSNYLAMEKVGEEFNSEGWIKEFDLGNTAEIIPRSNGGNTTNYKCDYHWVNLGTGVRTLRMGGSAADGASAGLSYFTSDWSPSNLSRTVGFRASLLA